MEEEAAQNLFKPPFACPYTGQRLDLQTMLDQLRRNPRFARWIRQKLRVALDPNDPEAPAAQECLASYYMPADDELLVLGDTTQASRSCTEHGRLLSLFLDF